jgi:hypothetical protein
LDEVEPGDEGTETVSAVFSGTYAVSTGPIMLEVRVNVEGGVIDCKELIIYQISMNAPTYFPITFFNAFPRSFQ